MNEFANTEGASAIPIHTLSARQRPAVMKSFSMLEQLMMARFTHS